MVGISLHQPGCLWTSETWRRFGPFPVDFHYAFDRYFFSKIAAEGRSTFLIANVLISLFRIHEGSKTVKKLEEFSREWGRKYTKSCEQNFPFGAG